MISLFKNDYLDIGANFTFPFSCTKCFILGTYSDLLVIEKVKVFVPIHPFTIMYYDLCFWCDCSYLKPRPSPVAVRRGTPNYDMRALRSIFKKSRHRLGFRNSRNRAQYYHKNYDKKELLHNVTSTKVRGRNYNITKHIILRKQEYVNYS